MGLLDKIGSAVRNTVSSAKETVEQAVSKVESKAAEVVSAPKDEFTAKTKEAAEKAPATALAKPAEHHWYSGISDAFSKTEASISKTVHGTVASVESKVTGAYQAVSDAGSAVKHAGQQVLDSGARVLHAAEKTAGDVATVAKDAGRLVTDAGATVVDAGKAAYHAGNAALTGDPRELDAAHNSIKKARADVADAHRAVTDAHAAITDVGAQASNVKGALTDAKKSLEEARDKLEAAGHSVKNAIDTVAGAPAQILTGVEKAVAQGGKDVRTAIERDVPGGKQMLAGLDKYSQGAKEIGEGVLGGNIFQIARGMRDEASGAVDFAKGAYESPAGQYAKQKLIDYGNGFNPDKQISELKPGESYSIRAGGNVHVEFGAEAKAGMTVKAETDGSFTVSASAVAGANGYLTPEKLGDEGVSAAAHLLLGGQAEFNCKNAEEAKHLTHILEKAAAAAAVSGQPVGGTIAAAALMPSKEDMAFLQSHATSVSLSGKLAAEASVDLEIPGLKKYLAAEIGAGVSEQKAVKIDLKEGKPVGVSFQTELAGELKGGVHLQLPGKDTKDASGKDVEGKARNLYLGAEGKVGEKVTVEQHFDLPKSVSLDELLKHPSATLNSMAQEMKASETDTVTIGLEGESKAGLPILLNKKGQFSAEAKFKGKASEVFNQDVLSKALHGDLAGALKESKVEGEGSLKTLDRKQWGFEDKGLTVAGVGVEGTLYAEKVKENPPVLEFKMKAGGPLELKRGESGEEEVTNSTRRKAAALVRG